MAIAAAMTDISWYQAMIEKCPNSIYVYDLVNQRNLFVNKEVGVTLGFTPDEIREMGENLFVRLMHPDDLHYHVPVHQQRIAAADDGEVYEIEYRIKHKDGNWCYMISRDTPFLRDEHGNVTAYLGIMLDITDHRYALEWEQKILNRIPHIVYVYDLKQQVNIYTNGEIWHKLGYTREELQAMGTSLFKRLFHPDDLKRTSKIQADVASLRDEDTLDVEYRLQHRDGHWVWFLDRVRVFLRDFDGSVHQYMGALYDITAQKELDVERARLKQRVIDAQAQQGSVQNGSPRPASVAQGLLIVPLVGKVDLQQAQAAIETLVEGAAQLHAETVILDLSGMQEMGGDVAAVMFQTIQTVRILGAQVLVTGVQMPAAQELVDLCKAGGGITVYSTIQDGIAAVFQNGKNGTDERTT
jgi:PAS domain S-box-containing protein